MLCFGMDGTEFELRSHQKLQDKRNPHTPKIDLQYVISISLTKTVFLLRYSPRIKLRIHLFRSPASSSSSFLIPYSRSSINDRPFVTFLRQVNCWDLLRESEDFVVFGDRLANKGDNTMLILVGRLMSIEEFDCSRLGYLNECEDFIVFCKIAIEGENGSMVIFVVVLEIASAEIFQRI
ncbi:hypothetical protein CDAR_373291 [Caerostris darwini]|uniref:Uncharacterized protein n=1 Tax=Caerostris darwini TaxID=1538125 RepID=A0AAV4MZI1_9ARAC|nr:hypothetical protein CDAR_373291 [Caerostris darwini]